jgi:hypothetical protein
MADKKENPKETIEPIDIEAVKAEMMKELIPQLTAQLVPQLTAQIAAQLTEELKTTGRITVEETETLAARKKRVARIESKERYDGIVKPGFGGVPKIPHGKPVDYMWVRNPQNEEEVIKAPKPKPLPIVK